MAGWRYTEGLQELHAVFRPYLQPGDGIRRKYMKKSNRGGYSGESWKLIEKIINRGKSRSTVFEDWLSIMLDSHLSMTDNLRQWEVDPSKWSGVYEERYLKTIAQYADDKMKGERNVDYFAQAFHHLIGEIEQSEGADCLGDIFESEITYGEHGQFFTPEPIARMMAEIIDAPSISEPGRQTICDPACGSGRMLIAAHRRNPEAFKVGIDLDRRCAIMCALNMLFRGIEGDAYWGNTLSGEMYTSWMVRPPYLLIEDAKPTTPPRIQKLADDAKAEQMTSL
jgi:hypothetical protein